MRLQNLLLKPPTASDLANGHPPGIPVLQVADFGFARWMPATGMAETLCGSPCALIARFPSQPLR